MTSRSMCARAGVLAPAHPHRVFNLSASVSRMCAGLGGAGSRAAVTRASPRRLFIRATPRPVRRSNDGAAEAGRSRLRPLDTSELQSPISFEVLRTYACARREIRGFKERPDSAVRGHRYDVDGQAKYGLALARSLNPVGSELFAL